MAEDDGRLVGFVQGRFRDVPSEVLDKWKATRVGHVTPMAVVSSHRRKGVGNALLARLLEEFKAAGPTWCCWTAPPRPWTRRVCTRG